jgi:hypothetical protein
MARVNSGRHRRPESVQIDDADDGDGLAEFPKVTCSGAAMPVKASRPSSADRHQTWRRPITLRVRLGRDS